MDQRKIMEITIYVSNTLKVVLFDNGTMMKRIFLRDGKPVEWTYSRVTDARKIQQIVNRSVKWDIRGISEARGYILLDQKDAYERLTGCCKVIKKERAIIERHFFDKPDVFARYSDQDWMYYERRS